MENFCFQCEQTVGGKGCTQVGNCGKDPKTSVLQDLVLWAAKGVSMYAHRAAQLKASDPQIGRAVVDALFTTVTNVDFDPERLEQILRRMGQTIKQAQTFYVNACASAGKAAEKLDGPAAFSPAADLQSLVEQAAVASLKSRMQRIGNDLVGLQELLIYGLKGTAAYAHHATVLGREDPEIYAFLFEALDAVANEKTSVDTLLGLALRCGEVNLKVMGMLNAAHTDTYGHPRPTSVRVTPVKGKAIVVSGHDLKDLEELLKQTEGKGINIYTHGEMLPAHGYPGLSKYPHLVGNYGGAWQEQVKEFDALPGAVLMTTNCIQKPKESYRGRIFTSGLVAYPGVIHVSKSDFSKVIEAALAAPGFTEDAPEKRITVGFGHQAVLGVADKVIDAVKSGAIKHFFLIGGCDGAKVGRNYYTQFAESVPKDCVILTLACGKYRFNKIDFGDINGIPRLLDIGQCNDAYSAVQIAVALANAFKTDVNSLPLSLIVSWYEQKAVAVLLTLLSLGIKNIRLGPSLPAFVTPATLKVLVEKFNLKPISNVKDDLADCLKVA